MEIIIYTGNDGVPQITVKSLDRETPEEVAEAYQKVYKILFKEEEKEES